jgi:hypothetical protein
MAVGNCRLESLRLSEDQPEPIVRLYFNLSPSGAVALMSSLTTQLNAVAVPFHFKVLYNPSDYGRYDSGVLYFDKRDYSTIHSILQNLYLEHQNYFGSEVPLFTKLLAPGLGLAEEPSLKFAAQESFGMNRCQIVANGLLAAQQQGDDSPVNRIAKILEHFHEVGIDLQCPYLNPNSEDTYAPLEYET